MASEAAGRDLRSLLVGYYRDGKLHYAGKVGAGFSQKLSRERIAKLEKHGRPDSPFVDIPRPEAEGATWVEPGGLTKVVLDALRRPERLSGMSRAAHRHALRYHSHAALARHILGEVAALLDGSPARG
jgi:ATP-dependent DNA ligase